MSRPGRAIWYVCGHENRSSIAVAERCGMKLVGKGGFAYLPAYRFAGLGAVMMMTSQVGATGDDTRPAIPVAPASDPAFTPATPIRQDA